MGTGETVAVKQIKLADLPKSELKPLTVRQTSLGDATFVKGLTPWCLDRDRPAQKSRRTLHTLHNVQLC